MAKTQKGWRVSKRTIRQVERLAELWGDSEAGVVEICVDRTYTEDIMYLALTTENPQTGWTVVAYGKDKDAVRDTARETIGSPAREHGTDIHVDTQQTNLRVVSKTEAQRDYGIPRDAEQYFYAIQDAVKVTN